MQPTRILSWRVDELAKALQIDQNSVKDYFTDGRRVAFLIERRIAYEEGFNLAPSEGASFDLIDASEAKWEVRNITRAGVYFCPSRMVGSGRRFEHNGFLHKLSSVTGYILADIESFPEIPYWKVPNQVVKAWWESGYLGSTTKVVRAKMLQLLDHQQ